MHSVEPPETPGFGHKLVDSLSIPKGNLDFLFAALFVTSLCVFVGSNLLLLDVSVLLRSGQLALPCLAVLLIFYAISRCTRSVIWGLVLTYGMLGLLVYVRQTWLIPVIYGVGLIALAYVIRFLRVERAQWTTVLLMAIIATAAILGVDRGSAPSVSGTFDMLNRLHAGDVYKDTLYHASIAAMIKNYGVSSTGLHGLVEAPYHVLSHVLYASISLLSGLGVIEAYGVANWVLFAPILVFGVVACSAMLDRPSRGSVPLAWCVACVLLTVLPFLFWRWAVWDFFLVSESYMVSLGLFLLGFPLLFKRRLSLWDLLLVVILTALISMAKMSVGPIFAGLWFARILLVHGQSVKLDLSTLALSAIAAAWAVFQFAGRVPGTFRVSPLSFVVTYSLLGDALLETGGAVLRGTGFSLRSGVLAIAAVLSFVAFHFFLSWVVLLRVACKKGIVAVLSSPVSVYSLAAVLVGGFFVLVIQTRGLDAYWFSNVALFAALPGVVCWVGQSLGERRLPSRRLLASGIVLVCLLGAKDFYQASASSPEHHVPQHSMFIASLMEVRQTAPLNVVLRPDEQAFAHNPVSDCTAQPFVFPAVSERPWIDVLAVLNDCTDWNYYYFRQYGITDSRRIVTSQPHLLPGMTILTWPSAAADFE